MPFSQAAEPEAPRLTVDDIPALQTAKLVKYLKQNPGPDGGFELGNVDGWADQPEAKLDELRLEANGSDATRGGPVNFGQLAARLLEFSNDRVAWSSQVVSPRSLSDRSPTPPPPPDTIKDLEITAYNELVEEGGRPLFSLDLLDQVSKNPREYHDILRPWLDSDSKSSDDWRVFSRQRDRWQDFCEWQRDNRNVFDNEGFSAFLEATKRKMALTGATKAITQSGFEEAMRKRWREQQDDRKWQRENVREVHDDRGFSGYAEAVKRRLANHGFTQLFHLEEDPKRQDTWTTWIEYIEFECWWLDYHTTSVERLRPQYDKQWKTLVDSEVLRTSETLDSLCTVEARDERESEEAQAEKAVQSARDAVDAPQHQGKSARTLAQVNLQKAETSFEATKHRNHLIREFIRGTQRYRAAKESSRRHGALVSWVLEQAPRIEAELKLRKAAEGGQVATGSRKRSRRAEKETPEEPSLKRYKQGGRETAQGMMPKRGVHIDASADPAVPTKSLLFEVASERATVRKPTIREARKETPGNSQRLCRNARCAAGTDFSSGAAVARTCAEWLKSLRARPCRETTRQSMVQGCQSKHLAPTKIVKRKCENRGRPESKNDGGSKRARPRRQPDCVPMSESTGH
ncbi:MAG: hypothetical protein M1816_003641 [Peltula sp. TS41687]|nr:MAG: hypothetical protein M1816_003641 [Peltula sp. TS41687]